MRFFTAGPSPEARGDKSFCGGGAGGGRLCPVLARIHSFILVGIEPLLCEVECDVANTGLDRTTVTGLPQTGVKESVERIERAMVNSGFRAPQHAVLINLAPADVKKEPPSLDLPIAMGLLRGSSFIQTDRHKDFLIAGELALDGRVRKIKGALSLALLAKHKGFRGLILPEDNAREAAVVERSEERRVGKECG